MVETLLDSYSETNYSTVDVVSVAAGQTFTTLNVAAKYKLTSAKFYLKLYSGTTYNLTAEVYTHSLTWGSNGIPTGTALAISNAITTGVTGDLALVTFTFTSTNQIYLSKNTHYCALIRFNSGDASIGSGKDTSAPSHSGNNFAWVSGGE
jgi:hypothetical protein